MCALQRLPPRPAALCDVQGAHAAGDNAIFATGPLQAEEPRLSFVLRTQRCDSRERQLQAKVNQLQSAKCVMCLVYVCVWALIWQISW
ncbi:hypothetical protein M5D96_000544 [Drosophila gunungcola]|uniref:Uncharacterized protein n=1 Tax=Drosophila gunungcola TaxID=103775 RepID=A0A9P9YWK3_9MUSC|nr:hypothetical protein M5D96_000544 [Drosophila gunungcola]